MAQEVITNKATKASRPDAGNANTRNVPVLAIVKDNIDPTRSGRLKVFIADDPATLNSNSSDSWITVSYMSTFFGKVIPQAGDEGYGDYKANPSSYGMWHAPPDIGSTVICIFINGDPNYGFWIGCVPDAEALYMVPAIGASDKIIANEGEAESYGGSVRLPVTNINTNNSGIADSPGFIDAPRPVHSYSASIMNQQGVIRDPIRGPISSSAQRETPSRVGWGVSTPGRPIYEGGFNDESIASNLDKSKAAQLKVVARRGGHSIVMDDGDIIGRDQLVRIRTSLGHQILMSDDGQTLMILHSNGQSYIELGKEGTVDIYSTNSINMRTQGDLNLHADNNINIHAMENINIQAKNMHLNTEEEMKLRSAKDIKTHALSNFTIKAGAAFAAASGGDSSIAAGGIAYVNGSKVNLNSGSASTQPQEIGIIPVIAQTDTLYDEKKGFIAAPGKLLTIASRAPAHAPWANAGQGVDVKTDLNASSQLPSAPSAAAASATEAGASVAPPPASPATAASAPPTTSVSSALDQNTTGALLGTVATTAATGDGTAAVAQGAAIVQTATGAEAGVGAFAQSATQLASSGVLKPGSDTLVNSLVQSGANISQAMPSTLFSGAAGAENLTNFTQNIDAQATSVVTNLQQAQTALTAVGAISGKEAPAAVAGLVTAAATTGVGPTVQAISQSAGSAVSTALGTLGTATGAANGLQAATSSGIAGLASASSAVGAALSAIGAGSSAAALATSLTGGLGGLASAVGAMNSVPSLTGLLDQTKGIAASAFDSIKNSFKPLKAGVPQNLTKIAKDAAAEAAAVASQSSQSSTSLLSGVTQTTSALGGIASSVTGAVSNATSALSSLTGISSSLTGTLSGVANVATSASNLSSALNNSVASVTGLTSTLTNTLTSSTTALSTGTAVANAATALTSGGTSALAQAANVVQQGATAASASALASGLTNLPGGIGTVASVVNNATGALNSLPGVGAVTGLINEAQTAMMNGLPMPEMPGGLNALSSLLSAGLPAGAAAQLQSAISTLSSGSGGAIKLPTIGLNTTDRGAITTQIASVLGDPKIPPPNLLGPTPISRQEAMNKIDALTDRHSEIIDRIAEIDKERAAAKKPYDKAKAELPPGDPEIARTAQAYLAVFDATKPEKDALLAELSALVSSIEQTYAASGVPG